MKTPSIAQLVRAARRAAKANDIAGRHTQAWVDLFEARYGHTDISDALVEVIDYSTGNTAYITAELIEENSQPDES